MDIKSIFSEFSANNSSPEYTDMSDVDILLNFISELDDANANISIRFKEYLDGFNPAAGYTAPPSDVVRADKLSATGEFDDERPPAPMDPTSIADEMERIGD